VTFLVDGFNLHFSVREAQVALGHSRLRWLNLRGLLSSFLNLLGSQASLEAIHFFTALPLHLHGSKPAEVRGHRLYIEVLRETNVRVHVAGFKRTEFFCRHCGGRVRRHEEKETDVSMAVKAMELLHLGACDTLVFVSGDTDFAPALRTAKHLFPHVQVCLAFPHARFNAELQQLADFSFRIRGSRYAQHQLPDPVELPSGRRLRRPSGW
jgi:hypothetical protein